MTVFGFGARHRKATLNEKGPRVCESVQSTYFYHINDPYDRTRPICGLDRTMMHTEIPLAAWGTKTHLNERWCKECKRILDERSA